MIKKGFSYIGIFFLYCLAILPTPLLYLFSKLSYYLLYYVVGYRRSVVRENLLLSFPEKKTEEIELIEKQFFRFLSDLIFEIVKMPLISKKELKKRYVFHNLDLLEDCFKKGRSVIVCSAHYGNWEWGMIALSIHLSETKFVIYKPLHNTVFDNWFLKIRSRFGNTLISMRQTLRSLADSKKITSAFFFASDQVPLKEPSNYWMTFMNQATPVYMGPEKIARQTNRPVFYFKTTVVKRGYYEVDCIPVCMEPKDSPEYEITENQFKLLTESIVAEPQYWLWSHKRWKHQPEIA
ncbi:lysophospholipid acyltransferase family protein [Pedobacter nutrimenti]|jgi:KDO2-lipid IV(A) lauroyltransferase|uniref:KDO2-lipid IV(A) lauroyltransferase n=1 Tax=Pedobacter nutrimenti TaxID=1241337 RepID=A0A318ULI8_9SPHI|nr:lysophospholipid acyltransferase family protein [Pedobacter nutrimenti]PYF76953.1 KDO2-lipid IV(A) lauroyltransferase [Pedobacter nutrimenti]